MRVLAIDGGGIRGIIPAMVLAEVERLTRQRICDLFDLVVATSTGGILACALTRPAEDDPTRPRWTAAQLVDAYAAEGEQIFRRSPLKVLTSANGFLGVRHDDHGLNTALKARLGADTPLGSALTPVVITAYDLTAREARFLRSEDPEDRGLPMWEVARATSAAPTFFTPWRLRLGDREVLTAVDGGVFAANPAMCAFAEVAPDRIHVMASLGTGSHHDAIPYARARWWGQLLWVRHLVDVVFDGMADTVDYEIEKVLRKDDTVFRFQTDLGRDRHPLDDFKHIDVFRELASTLIATQGARLEALCHRLTNPRPS